MKSLAPEVVARSLQTLALVPFVIPLPPSTPFKGCMDPSLRNAGGCVCLISSSLWAHGCGKMGPISVIAMGSAGKQQYWYHGKGRVPQT